MPLEVSAGDDVVHNLLLGQPEFARPQPVHIELKRGIIEILRDIHIAHRQESCEFLPPARGQP